MPQNGYRLFIVSLHDGMKREQQPFDAAAARPQEDGSKPPPVNYIDLVEKYVAENAGENFNMGSVVADGDEEDTGTRIGTSTRLIKSEAHGDEVRIWFNSGPILSEGLLSDPKGEEADIDLADRATLYDFRALLRITPGGRRGILAVEVRGRSCPAAALTRALKNCSDVPWRLQVHDNVADAAAVKNFIKTGVVTQMELTEWTFDKDGHRDVRLHSLTSRVDDGRQDASKNRLLAWQQRGKTQSVKQWREDASTVSKAFFTQNVGIAFNDVSFTVSSGTQTKTLKPSSDFEHFTYFLGKSIVSDSTFFSQAGGEASLLIEEIQIVGTAT